MIWERRWHPLREEWVTITSHRNARPWSGADKLSSQRLFLTHDPECYLCPGNTRVSGEQNPDYKGIYVFDNDHPSYLSPAPAVEAPASDFFRVEPAAGICKVVCYSPDHNGSLATASVGQTRALIDVWSEQTEALSAHPDVATVLAFENRGEVVGVSNPHPHGQIYAPGFVLEGIGKEAAVMEAAVMSEKRLPLIQSLLAAEREDGRRIVVESSSTTAFVPYFARFPYEVYIVPHAAHRFIFELSGSERDDLARVLNEVLIRYDNLWQAPFPYMLLLHQSPCDRVYEGYHTHIQLHPPLRQPGLQKYLASVETGAGHFLNDGCPEDKAAELRAVSAIHHADIPRR